MRWLSVSSSMSSIKEILDKVINKGKPDRRCMVCKYWKPVTECTGLCTYSDKPFYKHPNYVCSKFEPYK